jgi:quercetin dioxygenase-like cupin family protein
LSFRAKPILRAKSIGDLQEASMWQKTRLTILGLMVGTAVAAVGGQLACAQQQAIKRTDLLTLDLSEIKDNEMHVWVADIAPGAATGRHSHPTPRFVYVIEGAVVLEMDGKPPQTFKAGQAFAEAPNEVHNFRNASTTDPAKALGFQYAGKGQSLQINAP